MTSVASAPGYRSGTPLSLWVETLRQLRRRRTMLALGLLVALPLVLMAAFAVGGTPGPDGDGDGNDNGNGNGLVSAATASGPNFAAFTLFVSTGFLLVVAVALFCGDTVASEAGWSSLRYLLAAPVPRARLLWSKLVVAMGFSALAVVLLPVVSLLAGTLAYGWDDVQLPTGGSLSASTALQRMAVVAVYAFLSQLVVAATAFWLSTMTDAPLGAVGGAVGMAIVANVLDAVTALGSIRDFLPMHWQYAWLDALQPDIEWAGMIKGTSVSVAYSVVLIALGFRHFARKDIVS